MSTTIDFASLIQRAQYGDENAYNDVVAAMYPKVTKKAAKYNDFLNVNVESALMECVHRCIILYSPVFGEWEHYVNSAMASTVAQAQYAHYNDTQTKHVVTSIEAISADSETGSVEFVDERVDVEESVVARMSFESYRQRALSEGGEVLAKVVDMLGAGGYTLEEIADLACGTSERSTAAKKAWTQRQIARLRRLYAPERVEALMAKIKRRSA